jgi:hypothetical protein
MKYKFYIIFVVIMLSISSNVFAQDTNKSAKGKATFVTSKNVYVRFEDTDMIKIGDTLMTPNNTPCLLVSNKSSYSVVCFRLNDCDVKKDDIIIYKFKFETEQVVTETEKFEEDVGISFNDSIKSIDKKSRKKSYAENTRGRLSVSSYSNLSDIRDDTHRIVSSLSLNAEHLNNSDFSIDTYINYRQYVNPKKDSLSPNNELNVYNLALIYDVDSTLSVTVGRKINYKISTLGAIDGIQGEKFIGKNYVGAIVGFRPDIYDFSFNPNLLQYGAYVGRLTESENFNSQTTLGVAEQRNGNDIDRRFTYFQHSSTIFNNLNLFSSLELDIFNKVNDTLNTTTNNNPRLTNLYVSARYHFSRGINASLSYDSRKRVIYYKTYESDIERILDEDIARQGIRARINIKPFKYVFSGFSYSKRFQSDNENKSDNLHGYLSFSKIPVVQGRISLTYNLNSSNYLDSNIASLRYSNDFWDNRLSADLYYRIVNYKYKSDIPKFNQNYFGADLSYFIDRTLAFSLSGELSSYSQETNYRINARLVKRFSRSRKLKHHEN